jgi:alcohol dehydrogenase (cytochrome c)
VQSYLIFPVLRAGGVAAMAIRPKNGELVWHYQYMPNESFDLDGSAEPVIADLSIDGQVRKVLMSANKNGFLYLIDRTNGALIAAHPYVKVNWASHIDSETGRPVLTDVYDRAVRGDATTRFRVGSKEWR